MNRNKFYKDNTRALKEIEAGSDLLAFMAFNLHTPVVTNRVYFDGSENKTIILYHFTFRDTDWLLQRDVINDTWAVKRKSEPKAPTHFTFYSKQDIIEGKF